MLKEILLLHHTHTDIGYTHAQPVVWELNRQFIDDMLDVLDSTTDWEPGPRPTWTCEVTETLRYWLSTATARNLERFTAGVRAGRAITWAARCDTLGQPGTALAVADGGVTLELPKRGIVGVCLRRTQ